MTGPDEPLQDGHSQAALAAMAGLNRLILTAGLCKSRPELIFTILNQTIELARYQRAAFFQFTGKTPKLAGISGQTQVPAHSELGEKWAAVIGELTDQGRPQIIEPGGLSPAGKETLTRLAQATQGVSVLWLPLSGDQGLAAGIWLERWGDDAWREAELTVLAPLAIGYAVAYDKCRPSLDLSRITRLAKNKPARLAALAALALILAWRIPLRVVAPCEVAAKDPFVVTAPLNGVIAEVLVKPGQAVEHGTPLFVYDKRVTLEEANIARQQVQIIASTLNRSSLQAFGDLKARAELSLLELRLEQERMRLELAEGNVAKLTPAAEVAGIAVIDDPGEWRGRPVSVGERVLAIVDPGRSKLRIYLPVDDNLEFDPERPVNVHLNAYPESTLTARLVFVSSAVSASPQGQPCVLAEAEWAGPEVTPRIGLQGSAAVYGRSVSLAYWLMRKPLAFVRKGLGI